jgi:hypothetical protein
MGTEKVILKSPHEEINTDPARKIDGRRIEAIIKIDKDEYPMRILNYLGSMDLDINLIALHFSRNKTMSISKIIRMPDDKDMHRYWLMWDRGAPFPRLVWVREDEDNITEENLFLINIEDPEVGEWEW